MATPTTDTMANAASNSCAVAPEVSGLAAGTPFSGVSFEDWRNQPSAELRKTLQGLSATSITYENLIRGLESYGEIAKNHQLKCFNDIMDRALADRLGVDRSQFRLRTILSDNNAIRNDGKKIGLNSEKFLVLEVYRVNADTPFSEP